MVARYLILVLALFVLEAKSFQAKSPHANRIVGGSLTTINSYPYAIVLLATNDLVNFRQSCGGSILTTTSILSAAHCLNERVPDRYRIRVGSSFAHSGGTVHNVRVIINHPDYISWSDGHDISVVRTQTAITYVPNMVAPAAIAGSSYVVADNQPVWVIGWGQTGDGQPTSEQLRHVQIWKVNQDICRSRYAEIGVRINDFMLCAGWLDVGGRGQCGMDSGGPVLHNDVIVGVSSFASGCGNARRPNVNVRVSRYTSWIQLVASQ